MEQIQTTILTLTRRETSELKEGVTLINKSEKEKYIIFRDSDEFLACRNICKHQGGAFTVDIEDSSNCMLKCPKHEWKLDPSTMRYVNPPASFKQEQLVTGINDDGCLTLTEITPLQPWEFDKRESQPISPGEVKVTYFSHACMKLQFNNITFFTDPWLMGPAFARSWWLLHEPPDDWLFQLSNADLIYISHVHPDHLSYPTLKLVSEKNPNIPIYVGNTSVPVFCKLKYSGVQLNNIHVLEFGSWHEVNNELRFMIMMDGVHPDMDTCLLIDYKGHLILNTVDCTNPNCGKLPQNIDLMMGDFAGGATCFPLSFSGGKYTEKWKADFVKTERQKLLYYKTRVVQDVNPKVYCPFAGYFLEAHPSDKYIRDNNIRNSPSKLNALIKHKTPHVLTWTPVPGSVLDLAKALEGHSDYVTDPPPGTKIMKDSWDFDYYIDAINKNYDNEIFSYPDWIRFYYNWAGFKNYNLVIRMIETDDNFEPIEGGYDFLVDFNREVPNYPISRPSRKHYYIEIKNRMGVHRETVVHGLFWDNLASFNNRLFREPDTFHFQFWYHMQILLKKEPPDWNKFLQEQRLKGSKRKAVWKPSAGIKALAGCKSKNASIPYAGLPLSTRVQDFILPVPNKYWKIAVSTLLVGAVLLAYTRY